LHAGHPFAKSISLEEMNSREKAQKAQKGETD
jgi:hypothetical protein